MKRLFLFGPILFAAALILLTILQYDFLRGLGWHPFTAPTFDWPSGLALGPYGMWMTATFILSGFIMLNFSLRLRADLAPGAASQIGSALLACSSLALAGLAFTTDPTIRNTPATLHGRLHDLSFVLLGLTLLPAMIFLGKAFWDDPRWRDLGLYTWATVVLAVPTFILKGIAFYIFLGLILIWNEVIVARYSRHVT
jgi:Protein of unknown function (DUF998)